MTDEEAIEFLPSDMQSSQNPCLVTRELRDWMIQVIKTLDRCKMEDE